MLESKFDEKNINCDIKSTYNWFKKEDGRKTKCQYWKGKYACKTCSAQFLMEIENNKRQLLVKIRTTNYKVHDKLKKKIQIRGEKRKIRSDRIIIDGLPVVRANMICNHKSGN